MTMKRLLILVEGQTEKRFVTDLLEPHLAGFGLFPVPKIVVTGRTNDGTQFQGGILSFAQVEANLRPLFNDSAAALVTTMMDYYGLPGDFPGWESLPPGSPQERVHHLEAALGKYFNQPRFHPYLMLHEYEAMVFVQPEAICRVLNTPALKPVLDRVRSQFPNPEEINDDRKTAPSKRLLAAHAAYRKRQHGVEVLQSIGLEEIRKNCPHFRQWLEVLESTGRRPAQQSP
ncbi:MAG: DUF4276 family protein [Verrucomicrobia bacterium]|nr:DUF4276 family protein [Verrucomicrobiota bacterium]